MLDNRIYFIKHLIIRVAFWSCDTIRSSYAYDKDLLFWRYAYAYDTEIPLSQDVHVCTSTLLNIKPDLVKRASTLWSIKISNVRWSPVSNHAIAGWIDQSLSALISRMRKKICKIWFQSWSFILYNKRSKRSVNTSSSSSDIIKPHSTLAGIRSLCFHSTRSAFRNS